MSEYQNYEFLAIDRPLTKKQMGDLRACSTRVRITSTGFGSSRTSGSPPSLLGKLAAARASGSCSRHRGRRRQVRARQVLGIAQILASLGFAPPTSGADPRRQVSAPSAGADRERFQTAGNTPLSGCIRASGRTAYSDGTCPPSGASPSAPSRSRPALLHQAPS